jgi:hypothetical protein
LPLLAFFTLVALVMPVTRPEAAAPEGQLTYAFHVTLAPRWLDPGETESAITPFKVLFAIHDALVKPMPGGQTTPCLAESWSVTPDGTSYTFVLRQNIKFHNGEPVTAEDVKFSFDRYKGGAAKLLKEKVKDVQVLDARRDRAEEVRREGRRRRLQEGADRCRTVQVRQLHAGGRARRRGLRRLLAQDAQREAPHLQERPGRDHASRRAQAR